MIEYLVEAHWHVKAATKEQARERVRDEVADQPFDVMLVVTDTRDSEDEGTYIE